MIDEVYCINIRKRPDRLKGFKNQIASEIEKKLGLEIQYTTNWDKNLNGEDITDEWLVENNMKVYEDWKIEGETVWQGAQWGWWNRQLSRGEIGCTISHSEIWKRAKGNVLILEDDAVRFNENWFLKIYNTIDTLKAMGKEWDLIYLSRVPQDDSEKGGTFEGDYKGMVPKDCIVTKTIKTPLYSFCTYGYILSQRGIDKINKYNVHEGIIPADEFLSATYIEHPRKDISLKYPPTLEAYAIEPNMIFQANWGADTEDTGEKRKR